MKLNDKLKNKREKTKKKDGVNKQKPKKEKILVVAQEIKYARLLSGNDKKTRDKVLKALKKWLAACFEKNYEFKEDDFIRVWKGLFYAVWMSDKPLVQEELCENIASILDQFPPEQLRHALLMTKAGFKTLATEWYGIDQHRMDKFLMLVRRYLRGSFRCLQRCEWSPANCRQFADMLSGADGLFAVSTPHYARNATSMLMHIMDCYLEELAKVSAGRAGGAAVAALLQPFISQLARGALGVRARRLLTDLARQSELALLYEDKRKAWEQMGCPEGGPDALEMVPDDEEDPEEVNEDGGSSDEELENGPLDPRAGRVSVALRPLPVPAEDICRRLRDELARAAAAAHTRLRICLDRFSRLSQGAPPLPVSPTPPPTLGPRVGIRRAARNLHALENQLNSDTDELKLRGLSRKHRKRLLRAARAGRSIVEELHADTTHNGEWQVDTIESPDTTSDKENQHKAKKRKQSTALQVNGKKQKIKETGKDKKDSNNKKKLNKSKLSPNSVQDVKNIATKDSVKGKDKKSEIKENGVKPLKSNKDNSQKDSKTKEATKKDSQIKEVTKKDSQIKEVTKKDSQIKELTKKDSPKDVKKDNTSKELTKKSKFEKKTSKSDEKITKTTKSDRSPSLLVNKVKKIKKIRDKSVQPCDMTPKKVKFVLKNNSMQKPGDYYKSIQQSPSIPFDSSKKPVKTNLKPSTPSPINPFFKKKLKSKC